MLAADTLEALGVPRGQYVVKVNNRKVLDGVLEAIGLGGAGNAGRRLIVLRAMDKLDRLGPLGVQQLLAEGRRDESGDFTPGAGLTATSSSAVISSITLIAPWVFDQQSRLEKVHRFFSRGYRKAFSTKRYREYLVQMLSTATLPDATNVGLEELESIRRLVRAAGYERDQIRN